MNWKAVLKELIGFGSALAWTLIVDNNPDFPLLQAEWVNFVVYVFGGVIGGWGVIEMRLEGKTGKTYKQLVEG